MTVLVDTGPLVALLSRRDTHHTACIEQFKTLQPPLLTSWPVMTEAAWLLRHHPRIVQQLLESTGSGWVTIAAIDNDACHWIADFMRRYQDVGAQLADASLVYLAEREQIDTVFTLDRRDFSVYRFGHNRSFQLLPT